MKCYRYRDSLTNFHLGDCVGSLVDCFGLAQLGLRMSPLWSQSECPYFNIVQISFPKFTWIVPLYAPCG